jgi:S1-C subfamily serine protease
MSVPYSVIFSSVVVAIMMSNPANAQQNSLPVAAPLTTDSTNSAAPVALNSVMRVICAQQDSQGTGFLHKSGKIITAHHVIKDCSTPQLLLSNGTTIGSTVDAADPDFDLAILTPASAINVPALKISTLTTLNIGAQVSTWGFPRGVFRISPDAKRWISIGSGRHQNGKRRLFNST